MKLVSKIAAIVFFGTSLVIASYGCRSIRVKKHDPDVVVSSNSVIVVEGGWEADYWSYGVFTSLGRLDIDIATNHTVTVSLRDLQTDMSTNHVVIIDASGKSVADIASKIIEALK